MKGAATESRERVGMAGIDGDPLRLEELVDKSALREMVASSERIFGLPIRVFSISGALLAGAGAGSDEEPLHLDVRAGARSHTAANGALYRVIPLRLRPAAHRPHRPRGLRQRRRCILAGGDGIPRGWSRSARTSRPCWR